MYRCERLDSPRALGKKSSPADTRESRENAKAKHVVVGRTRCRAPRSGTTRALLGQMKRILDAATISTAVDVKSVQCPPFPSRDLRRTRWPCLRPLTQAVLKLDLVEEADILRLEQGWRTTGHSAKTLVKHHDFRIVLIVMKMGTRMPQHRTGGASSIHVIAGRLCVRVDGETIEVRAGSLLALDRALSHDIEATEASTFTLSLVAKL